MIIDLFRATTARSARTTGPAHAADEFRVTDAPAAPAEGIGTPGRPFSELEPERQRVLVRRLLEAEESAGGDDTLRTP